MRVTENKNPDESGSSGIRRAGAGGVRENIPRSTRSVKTRTAKTDLAKTYKIDENQNLVTSEDCNACGLEVGDGDEAIKCDECNCWIHVACSKIKPKTYELLKNADDFEWRCQECKQLANRMKDELVSLRLERETLLSANKALSEKLESLECRIVALKGEVKQELGEEIKNDVMKEVQKSVEEALSKFRDREVKSSRECNLIMYKVTESLKIDGKDREEDDRKLCAEVIKQCIGNNDYKLEKVVRLGKREQGSDQNKMRPVMITLESANRKWNVIKNAKNMKNAEDKLKGIVISLDLTKEEREREFELRSELRKKRDNGERDWVIRRGKLVKGNFLARVQ